MALLKRMLFSLFRITLGVLIGFGVLLYFVQNFMIYHPVAYGDGEVDGYVANAGVARLPFTTREGSQEAYWITRGGDAGNDERLPGTIWLVFSGNAALALDWVNLLASYRGPRAGFLLIDYPGYGACEGSPSPPTILESTQQAVAALGAHLQCGEAADLRSRLAVLGQSLGAAAGLRAAVHYHARRVVLISPFTTMVDMARRSVGPLYCQLVRHRWDNVESLGELTRLDERGRVSILHGRDDGVIPVSMSRTLADQFPELVDLEEFPGLGHNDMSRGASGRIVAAIASRRDP